ncbi:MAG: hypothetical protein Q4G40_08905, partial [Brachybacterium sp.]|nr:hypothetical protein [Brachybacterium sp.]
PVLEIRTLTDLRRRRRRDAAPSALPLLVVTADPSPSEEDWQACLETGARSLLRLPRQSDALLEHLGALLRRRSGCHLIGVTGGAGGAGASSWAARLAGAAARHGGPTVLVDADPLGGGMDVLIEAPSPDRGAWEDLGHLGAGDGEMLREGLPLIDGVGLLTSRAAAGHPLPDEVIGALAALGELDGTAVVDLAAQLVPDALPHLDRLVVVVPATDHGVRAAWRRLQVWRPPSARTGVVVRRVGPLAPRDVAGDLALPLWGAYRDAPRGAVPLMDRRRGGPDRLCEQLLRDWSATS